MEGLIGFGVFVVALLVFLATGAPVAVATGLLGILGVYVFLPPAAIAQLGNIALSQSANFVLVTVPLFVMMGEALEMIAKGYDPKLALGVTAAGGTLGILIPRRFR